MNIRENYNASLTCKASGIPDPEIIWKREDGRKIILKRKKKEGKRGKKTMKSIICMRPSFKIVPKLFHT